MKKQVTIWLWSHPCAQHGTHVMLFGGDSEDVDNNASVLMSCCDRALGAISDPRREQFMLDLNTGDVEEMPF